MMQFVLQEYSAQRGFVKFVPVVLSRVYQNWQVAVAYHVAVFRLTFVDIRAAWFLHEPALESDLVCRSRIQFVEPFCE